MTPIYFLWGGYVWLLRLTAGGDRIVGLVFPMMLVEVLFVLFEIPGQRSIRLSIYLRDDICIKL